MIIAEELEDLEGGDLSVLVTIDALEGRVWFKSGQRGNYLSLSLNAPLTLRNRDQEALY